MTKSSKPNRPARMSPWVLQSVLLGPILVAIAVTVALWEDAPHAEWMLLTLFAAAGAVGGFLRSSAYALATRSFSNREFQQWKTEALFAPVLGAASGLGAYLIVDAALVAGGSVNQAGQYIFSLLAGTASLSIVGQYVERGLARSATSRSGVLGGESSGVLPLISRFDELLDERLSEQTTVNFTGYVEVIATREGEVWLCKVWFMGLDGPPNALPHTEFTNATHTAVSAPVQVLGGVDRPVVPFTLSVVSASHRGLPAVLAVAAPRMGPSTMAQLLVERLAPIRADEYVAVEIGQAGATWQIVKVELSRGVESTEST